MEKKTIIAGAVAAIIIGSGAFYAGETYAQGKTPMRGQFGNGQFMQFADAGMARGARGGAGMFTAGEILSKDATSITIKMQDGSTKIVLMGTSTPITKSAEGSLSDLSTGTNVVVTGSANADGSLTAQSVQIRPAGDMFMIRQGGGRPQN